MMRLSDATKLASTKLRTRKVRLVVTIVIAGLMFSVLAAASLVSRGAFDSLASFNKEGFGERYIIAAQSQNSVKDPSSNQAVIDRAIAINKDVTAKKVALAKQLGIEYDPKTEPSIVSEQDGPEGKKIRSLDINQAAAQQAIAEYSVAHPGPGLPELKKLADKYDPVAYYQSRNPVFSGSSPDMPVLKPVIDGKEAVDEEKRNPQERAGLTSFSSEWGLLSRDLLKPFMLPNENTAIGKDGSIPVIAPFSAVEQILGLKALPKTAEPQQQLARIREVRSRASSIDFQVCYRNKTSADLIDRATSQQREIAQNKNDKDYVKPKTIYGLPAKPCTPATIVSDGRSAFEKQNDSKREQFEQAFGSEPAQQALLNFRVVGIAPNPPSYSGSFVSQIISSILSSNLGYGGATWFTPYELTSQQPLLDKVFPPTGLFSSNNNGQLVELASASQAEQFIKQNECSPDFSDDVPRDDQGHPDPFAFCNKQGKYFALQPFGSNSLALNSISKAFNKVFSYVALGVAIVAGIIMIGTVGRTIADSRRETAVFRAIGAKKLDIVQIYLVYTLFLSLMIFGFALLVGFSVSLFVNNTFSNEITNQTLLAFNAQDLTKTFSFYDFYLPDITKLLGLAIAGGLLSAFFPLLRNLRRNPIRDMRDDT